jgi:hypothetical protein
MTRIVIALASFSLILLVAALVVGLSVGDLYNDPSEHTLRWATAHRLTGVAAALAVVFVESVIVTYFIGTSRWCKEVAETYRLDAGPVRESSRLKRRAFAVAIIGMLTVIGIIALGGAADPSTRRDNTQAWTNYHLAGALAGTALIGWTYFAAWQYVSLNQAIILEMVAEVARIRRQRGLEPLTTAPK